MFRHSNTISYKFDAGIQLLRTKKKFKMNDCRNLIWIPLQHSLLLLISDGFNNNNTSSNLLSALHQTISLRSFNIDAILLLHQGILAQLVLELYFLIDFSIWTKSFLVIKFTPDTRKMLTNDESFKLNLGHISQNMKI